MIQTNPTDNGSDVNLTDFPGDGGFIKLDPSMAEIVYSNHDADNHLHVKQNFQPYVFIKPTPGKEYLKTILTKVDPVHNGDTTAATYPVGIFLVNNIPTANGKVQIEYTVTVLDSFTASQTQSKGFDSSISFGKDQLDGEFNLSTKFDTAKKVTNSEEYTYVQTIPEGSGVTYAYSSVLVMVEVLFNGQKGENQCSVVGDYYTYNFYAINRNDVTLHKNQCKYELIENTDKFYEILRSNTDKWHLPPKF